MQLVTHNHPQVWESYVKSSGDVELICWYKMPVVAGVYSPEGQQ